MSKEHFPSGKSLVSPDEFGQQVAASYGLLLRTARAILRSEADAEDAGQQAFCRAYEHRHQLRRTTLRLWLRRITASEALAALRTGRCQAVQANLDGCADVCCEGTSVLNVLIARDGLDRVLRAIGCMAERHKAVLMNVARGEALSEIVQPVRAPASCVKVRRCRASATGTTTEAPKSSSRGAFS